MTTDDVIVTREQLMVCATGTLFTPLVTEHANERTLQPKRVQGYLETLTPEARAFAQRWLSTVRYVGFNELYLALVTSLRSCLAEIGAEPWAILIHTRKYGSDQWLLQLLFQDELKGKEPPIIHSLDPKVDPKHIVVIDDCSYSGGDFFALLDESAYLGGVVSADNKIPRGWYTVHIVCPFVSEYAYPVILDVGKTHGYNITFYIENGALIPSGYPLTDDFDEKLYPYHYKTKNGEPFLRDDLVQVFGIDEISALVAIYFDHKIASSRSTAESILEAVVYPPPSRGCIERAETCWHAIQK